MAGNLLEDILKAIREGNQNLADIEKKLAEPADQPRPGVSAGKKSETKPKKDDGRHKGLEKLFGQFKKYGGSNPIISTSERVAKFGTKRFTSLAGYGGKVGTDGGSTPTRPRSRPQTTTRTTSVATKPQLAPKPARPSFTTRTKRVASGAARGVGSAARTVGTAGLTALRTTAMAAGAALTTVAGVAAGVAIGAAAVVGGFTALVVGTKKLASAFVESQREFAKYNGRLAVAFAIDKAKDIQRNIKIGAGTAAGTAEFIRSFGELKDALAPVKIAITNLITSVGTPIVRIVTRLIDVLSPLWRAINWLAETINAWLPAWLKQQKPQNAPLLPGEQLFNRLQAGDVPRAPGWKKRETL